MKKITVDQYKKYMEVACPEELDYVMRNGAKNVLYQSVRNNFKIEENELFKIEDRVVIIDEECIIFAKEVEEDVFAIENIGFSRKISTDDDIFKVKQRRSLDRLLIALMEQAIEERITIININRAQTFTDIIDKIHDRYFEKVADLGGANLQSGNAVKMSIFISSHSFGSVITNVETVDRLCKKTIAFANGQTAEHIKEGGINKVEETLKNMVNAAKTTNPETKSEIKDLLNSLLKVLD